MRNILAPIFTSTLLAVAAFTTSAPSQAETLSACGNMEFGASVQCEMEVEGGCVAKCEPISFTAECSAELYVDCRGQCSLEASVDCSVSCQASCEAECNVNPGSFECAGECRAQCGGECEGSCAAGEAGAKCRASCKSNCAGSCDAKCNVTPPSADCKAKCDASCKGSCEAKANAQCQVDCQAKGYAKCETNLQGGCEAQCKQPDGALFCDGQYVDARDQLDKCVAELKSALNVEVKGYAYGDSQCSGNECTAQGEAGFTCSASNSKSADVGSALGLFGAMAAFGMAISRRRRR